MPVGWGVVALGKGSGQALDRRTYGIGGDTRLLARPQVRATAKARPSADLEGFVQPRDDSNAIPLGRPGRTAGGAGDSGAGDDEHESRDGLPV
jgi:hypothetical protein